MFTSSEYYEPETSLKQPQPLFPPSPLGNASLIEASALHLPSQSRTFSPSPHGYDSEPGQMRTPLGTLVPITPPDPTSSLTPHSWPTNILISRRTISSTMQHIRAASHPPPVPSQVTPPPQAQAHVQGSSAPNHHQDIHRTTSPSLSPMLVLTIPCLVIHSFTITTSDTGTTAATTT
ncbi:hypothetical protein C8R46DRAFT_1122091 [Mycena filopes]|nr:hypothetical protein C8R46DRAFT_1122091 [Mycena filopes]